MFAKVEQNRKNKKKTVKRLELIIKNRLLFDETVNAFIDTLIKRRDWHNLEDNIQLYKKNGWENEQLKKIMQWERKAHALYDESYSSSLKLIKKIAHNLNDKQYNELEKWIADNSYSKKVWNKGTVDCGDNLSTIKARVVHLIFMVKSNKPVNIGNIINKKVK